MLDINFLDYAASQICKALLSIFYHSRKLSYDKCVSDAYFCAKKLEEKKTNNAKVNHLAVDLIAGIIVGFFLNSPDFKSYSNCASLHMGQIDNFVKIAYDIAAKMLSESQKMQNQSTNASTKE